MSLKCEPASEPLHIFLPLIPESLDHTPHILIPHEAYSLNPAPCTLNPKPQTLIHVPYSLHPTPFILHPQPYTLHPTPTIRNPEPYTI